MLKGKVGDKARIVKLCSHGAKPENGLTLGAEIEIQDLCADGSPDEHYTVRTSTGYIWWYYDSEIEITTNKKKVRTRFKIGDEIVVTRNTPTCQEGFIGLLIRKGDGKEFDWIARSNALNVTLYEDEMHLLKSHQGSDAVHSPKHYAVFDDIEAIEVIARSMTQEMFKGYCFGNLLKYRLRVGGKDEVMQELGKADKYKELYEKFKGLCQ